MAVAAAPPDLVNAVTVVASPSFWPRLPGRQLRSAV